MCYVIRIRLGRSPRFWLILIAGAKVASIELLSDLRLDNSMTIGTQGEGWRMRRPTLTMLGGGCLVHIGFRNTHLLYGVNEPPS